MQISLHKNATTTPAIRQLIQNSTGSIKSIANKFNISIVTARKWRSRQTIFDASHVPKNMNKSLSDPQEELVLAIREILRISIDDLLNVVKEFIYADMSRAALSRLLARHKVPTLRQLAKIDKDANKTEKKSFKHYDPGFIHIDIKYLPKMEGKSNCYLFVAIDRATRWVFVKIYEDQSEKSSVDFLNLLYKNCPVTINKILTDNGTQFTDRFTSSSKEATGNHAFDKACAKFNIVHRLIPPRHPQTNGMVERFNGRISEILTTHHFDSQKDLNELLYSYVKVYNEHLPQRALNGQTPLEKMKEYQTKMPQIFKKNVVLPKNNLAGLDK